MYKKISALCILFLVSSFVNAGQKYNINKYSCKKVTNKIEYINSQLRAGFTVRRGEQLKEDLRAREKQRRSCKHKGFKVDDA